MSEEEKKELHRARSRQYYRANREEILARLKAERERGGERKETLLNRARKWKAANPDKIRDQHLKWRAANLKRAKDSSNDWKRRNSDQVAAYNKQWRAENPDKVRVSKQRDAKKNSTAYVARAVKWQKANPDKARRKRAKYALANPEIIKASNYKWQAANREKVRLSKVVSESRRRAARKNGGSFTSSEWRELLKATGKKCLACGARGKKLTVDHVVPLSMGGTGDIGNIQPLCSSCNTRKHAKHIDYRQPQPPPGG